ncbi:uncharacterized protein [Heterodontus francisci]|uniref:uncharacterized protein isoform X3 n=1 Tax=Heterodontus francisci TaxID=7792 RepID=UPI00355B0238
MECPLCGDQFSEMVIQHHAWHCDGSKLLEEGVLTQEGAASSALIQGEDYQPATCTSYFHQHLNEVGFDVSSDMSAVPHSSTEKSQETAAAAEVWECPLCRHYFLADQIVEHAAFCNGPSYSQAQEQTFSSYSRAQEREIPSYSRCQEREILSYSRAQKGEIPSCSRSQVQTFSSYSRAQEREIPSYSQAQEREIPSYSRAQEREIPSYSRPQEREIPSYSRPQEREIPTYSGVQERRISSEDVSSTMQLFWRYISGKEVPGAAAGSEGPRRVLSSRGAEGGSVSDIEKALQYLEKMEHRITQDPEFNQVFGPLLKSPNPLHILQCLSNAIFSRRVTVGAGRAAHVFLFFQLAKLFLPTILQSKSFAFFKKWVEVFILEMVVPWISQMGGWGSVLCFLGALLASGLVVGLVMQLMMPNSNK